MNSPTNLDTLLKEILITPLVGAMIERGIKPAQSVDMVTLAESLCFGPPKSRKCECVTEYALNGNPDRIVEWADEKCPLCDGDGIQKRDTPIFCKCGDERCEHGGCENEHCRYFCTRCQQKRDADREAAYQRDVAAPLLGLDEDGAL